MKLYDRLPDSVTVNGKRIKLDLDFRNVIKMIDILSRDELTQDARDYLALRCVCRHPKKGMMAPVRKLLFPNSKPADNERLTDFEQDADLIRAAFMQEYKINLFRDRLHWFEFCCLLSCLPSGSKYTDILSIRARPMPSPEKWNAKEREWLARAKMEYAVKLTPREHEKNYERSVQNIGRMLAAIAGKGDKTE